MSDADLPALSKRLAALAEELRQMSFLIAPSTPQAVGKFEATGNSAVNFVGSFASSSVGVLQSTGASTVAFGSGPLNNFTVGVSRAVHTTGNGNVRSTPGGTLLGTQPIGSAGLVTGGPIYAELDSTGQFFFWWQINFDNGFDGWIGDNQVGPEPPPISNPWLPPVPDTTIHLEAWTIADIISAHADAVTWHTTHPNDVVLLLAPAGSASTPLTSWPTATAQQIGKVIFDFNGNMLTRPGSITMLYQGNYLWKQLLNASVGFAGGNATCQAASAWSSQSPAPVTGDPVKLFSNHRWYGEISYQSRHGEIMDVLSTSGTTLTLDGDPVSRSEPVNRASGPQTGAFALSDGPALALLNKKPQIWLVNPKITAPAGSVAALIRMKDLKGCAIINPTLRVDSTGLTSYAFSEAIDFQGMYQPFIVNPDVRDTSATTAKGFFGYAIQTRNGKNCTIIRETGNPSLILGLRHGPDSTGIRPTSATTTANVTLGNIYSYGAEYSGVVDGLDLSDMKDIGLNIAHCASDGKVIQNCVIHGPRNTFAICSRGKRNLVQDNTFTSGATNGLMQHFVYAAYAPDWTDPSVPDGSWYDSSGLTFRRNHCTVNFGSAWSFNPDGLTYAQAFDLLLDSNSWTINNTGNFDFSQCGNVTVNADTVAVNGSVTTLYSITRPGTTIGGIPTSLTFGTPIINLSGHANSGTMKVVSVGANCAAVGTINCINKPASMTLTMTTASGTFTLSPGNNTHDGLTVNLS